MIDVAANSIARPNPTIDRPNPTDRPLPSPDSRTYTEEDVIAVIASTPTGARARVRLDSARGNYSDGRTVHLDPNQTFAEAVWAMAHELGHPYQDRKKLNQGNVRRQTREDYINTEITNEVYADNIRHQIYSELENKALMKEPVGHGTWDSADPADRERIIRGRFVGPNAIYSADTTGQTYPDYYGAIWDAAHPPRPERPRR